MRPAGLAKIEVFLHEYEKVAWYDIVAQDGTPTYTWPQREYCRETAHQRVKDMSASYGVRNVRDLGSSLWELLGLHPLWYRLTYAAKVSNRIERYAEKYKDNLNYDVIVKHIEEMRAFVGDPDENNYHLKGDWEELRNHMKVLAKGIPQWLSDELNDHVKRKVDYDQ